MEKIKIKDFGGENKIKTYHRIKLIHKKKQLTIIALAKLVPKRDLKSTVRFV